MEELNMWKDVLKLSPEDRKEFNELGDKYAPEDMEEANLNRNMINSGNQIKKDIRTYEKARDKIESMRDKINPNDYRVMQVYLKRMEENAGKYGFSQFFQALKTFSRNYPIFFR